MRRAGWWWAAGAVWAVATAANVLVWAVGVRGVLTHLSNLALVLALPALIPLRLAFDAHYTHPGWMALVNAVAVAGWVAAVRLGLGVRRRLRGRPPGSPAPGLDLSRRRFLLNSASGVVASGAVALPGYVSVVEPQRMVVRRYQIPIEGLPAALDGLRVVHLSDPHVGPLMPRGVIEEAVERAAGLGPDLAILTGDYIHAGTRDIRRAAGLMAPLARASRMGAIGVLGNHDWYGDGAAMRDALRSVGVVMIDNGRVWLHADGRVGPDAPDDPRSALALVGLGDLSNDRVDPDAAFAGIDGRTPRLVLAHQPDTAEIPALLGPDAPRMDLMLSGHTHGGQVRIPFVGTPLVPSRYGQKYAGGLVRGPRCPVLVSRGVGLSLLPVRLGVPPEIGLVTLRRG